MKIFTHSYFLTPLSALNAKVSQNFRKGLLICVEDQAGVRGYADLHPWPELGDNDLDSVGMQHPLFQAAISNAQADLVARSANTSLLEGADKIFSHFLCSDINSKNIESRLKSLEQSQSCYSKIKVKCGSDLEAELLFLEKCLDLFAGEIRLDFNSSLTATEYRKFIARFSDNLQKRIEFIEDPCRFDAGQWHELHQIIPLACDFPQIENLTLSKWPFAYRIVKPSRMKPESIDFWKNAGINIVVTSSMSHGLDILQSLAVALKFPDQVHGLQTFDLYQRDEISSSFSVLGPYIKGIQINKGLGYASELERLEWKLFAEF